MVGSHRIVRLINDPENQEKIESFTTFLQDSVPVILVGLLRLIGCSLGMKLLGFVNLFLPLVKESFRSLGWIG